MNYYKRHIGDYATRTRTLSPLQHGYFTLLLDHYYTEEGPITTEDSYSICQARTKKEREAVLEILRRYFDEQENGTWRNDRCDAEIAEYYRVVEKNRTNGRKHKPGNVPRETPPQANPQGEPLGSHPPTQNQPSHYPLPNTQEEEKEGETRARDLAEDWKPPEWIAARLKMAGHPGVWTAADLGAFIAHYRAEPIARTEKQWAEKFVKWMIGGGAYGGTRSASQPEPPKVARPTCCNCHRLSVGKIGGASYCEIHLPEARALLAAH